MKNGHFAFKKMVSAQSYAGQAPVGDKGRALGSQRKILAHSDTGGPAGIDDLFRDTGHGHRRRTRADKTILPVCPLKLTMPFKDRGAEKLKQPIGRQLMLDLGCCGIASDKYSPALKKTLF